MEYTVEELQVVKARYLKEAETLKEKYGTGIRPSWVSTDISLAYAYANRVQDAIDELEKENGS